MSKRSIPIIGGGVLAIPVVLGVLAAAAQELPGDAVAGRELAISVCAECHAVEPGVREGALPDPPAFQRLADDPAMTPLALRVFLTTPHTNMPNLILSGAEVDDVIAYIHSLKSQD